MRACLVYRPCGSHGQTVVAGCPTTASPLGKLPLSISGGASTGEGQEAGLPVDYKVQHTSTSVLTLPFESALTLRLPASTVAVRSLSLHPSALLFLLAFASCSVRLLLVAFPRLVLRQQYCEHSGGLALRWFNVGRRSTGRTSAAAENSAVCFGRGSRCGCQRSAMLRSW
jgi:hypothetical protein